MRAREVLDSRGNPTVEVDVILDDGTVERMIAPAGASTGKFEALEIRDHDQSRFEGRGVLKAVSNINNLIAPKIVGLDPSDQAMIDRLLLELDGTENKSRLGANAILGVSVAAAKAAATAMRLPLYRYLGGANARELPVPMINVISGGLHAGGNLDFQDFSIIPLSSRTLKEAIEMASNVYRATRELLKLEGYHVGLVDEGGFGPPLGSNKKALEIIGKAVQKIGYNPGEDIALALDVASTHFYENGKYRLEVEKRSLSTSGMTKMLAEWVEEYPIISLEDPLSEEDWEGWTALTDQLGRKVQIIGDDLFTTNVKRIQQGVQRKAANAVLIKMNQIGTLSETLKALEITKGLGYLPIVSARSGESEDATVADLAVATNAGQIKIGSLARSERLAKYNQLLRIEEELGFSGIYRGRDVFSRFSKARLYGGSCLTTWS